MYIYILMIAKNSNSWVGRFDFFPPVPSTEHGLCGSHLQQRVRFVDAISATKDARTYKEVCPASPPASTDRSPSKLRGRSRGRNSDAAHLRFSISCCRPFSCCRQYHQPDCSLGTTSVGPSPVGAGPYLLSKGQVPHVRCQRGSRQDQDGESPQRSEHVSIYTCIYICISFRRPSL